MHECAALNFCCATNWAACLKSCCSSEWVCFGMVRVPRILAQLGASSQVPLSSPWARDICRLRGPETSANELALGRPADVRLQILRFAARRNYMAGRIRRRRADAAGDLAASLGSVFVRRAVGSEHYAVGVARRLGRYLAFVHVSMVVRPGHGLELFVGDGYEKSAPGLARTDPASARRRSAAMAEWAGRTWSDRRRRPGPGGVGATRWSGR
jgi:hypothetical protein